ncbi:MAG TPA: sigma-70 family RNA polymerase sigma factor [Mycobacteriales bacterium]|nr:sigma-70 family RNA polymerase sigma factor [Mycobacteriales bacterium]
MSRDEEFRSFYAAQFPPLAGYCLALTSNPALADEIAQDALTEVYVKWTRVREPRAYAFRVAHNIARESWRKRDRELATWSAIADAAVAGSAPDPALWDAVSRLPIRLREVVLLHYLCDLPIADIALTIRRPLGTVKRQLHDARAQLAVSLGGSR